MPLMTDVLWVIYRDDVSLPDDKHLVEFVRACLSAYKKKIGITPTQVGVSSSFPMQAEQDISGTGVRVVRNLPAWSRDEVWVGGDK